MKLQQAPRSLTILLLVALLLSFVCPAAGGEMASPSAAPVESGAKPSSSSAIYVDEDALPKVIDHMHFPDLYPDFAFSGDDDLLEVWFPSSRDQDSTIYLYQDQVWMLDCGDERALTESVPLLRYLGVDHVDRIINTHPHPDHLNGLYSIDADFPVRELMVCFPEDSISYMADAVAYCKEKEIPVTMFGDDSLLQMGDGLVTFLAWMKTNEDESMNDQSAQFMVSYGSCNLISMADMELHGQWQLYDALPPSQFKADILRYPHHGKKFMYEELYQAISPELVIVSNSSRIIDIEESTRFLDYKHVPVSYTRRLNYVIHLVTNGHRWLCEEIDFDPKPYLNLEEGAETEAGAVGTAPAVVTSVGTVGTPASGEVEN